jgi:predicted GIY-YIG superfamily endonuclease
MSLWSRNTYYSDYCNKPSCVYRLYDAEGALLYVGMTVNPLGRIPAHKRKPWGDQIDHHAVEWFENRVAAKEAERSAIRHENPIHNITRPRMECC